MLVLLRVVTEEDFSHQNRNRIISGKELPERNIRPEIQQLPEHRNSGRNIEILLLTNIMNAKSRVFLSQVKDVGNLEI